MTKALLIYLALNTLAFSLPSSYIRSIVSLGNLFSHFHDHHHSDHHQSFIGFLKSHYLDQKHHEADHEAHGKLPFQHDHQEGLNLVQSISLLPPFTIVDCSSKQLLLSMQPIIGSHQCVSSYYQGDIWQPPKA